MHSDVPTGRLVLLSSRGFTRARLVVVGFIPALMGSLVRTFGS